MSLGEYLKQIRNEKLISQRELAEKSGISNAEISRIESGERQKPSPDALRAIAPVLGLSYETLMDKAGYIDFRAIITENKQAEEKFIEIVTPKLIKVGWSVVSCNDHAIGDILATKNDMSWYIDFKYIKKANGAKKNLRDIFAEQDSILRIYGKLATYVDIPISKFSIAVNNEGAFNNLIKIIPRNLKISVSIILVDFTNRCIVSEQQLT